MEAATDGRIGIWMTSALVVGTIIGSGIFLLPVSLAPLGASAVAGWIISGAGALAVAFTLACLSRLGGDGIQANIERQLGRTTAFLVAWSFWVSSWTGQAAAAIAGASALSWIDPALRAPEAVATVAIAATALFTVLNAFGVRASGVALLATVAIRLLPLGGVILIVTLRGIGPAQDQTLARLVPTPATLATATALTFFALQGFENATTLVDKVRDPGRTIPRAIMSGTLFVAILFLAAGTSVQSIVPAARLASSPAPFADAFAGYWGRGAGTVAALAIATAAFGCLNALILGTGELGYAMGLRRDLPHLMSWTWRGNTPVAAQLVGAAVSALLILANDNRATAHLFTFVILLSTAAVLVVYLASALSAWRLDPSPRSRAVTLFALLFIAFAFYGTGAKASVLSLLLLAIGWSVRSLVHRFRSSDFLG